MKLIRAKRIILVLTALLGLAVLAGCGKSGYSCIFGCTEGGNIAGSTTVTPAGKTVPSADPALTGGEMVFPQNSVCQDVQVKMTAGTLPAPIPAGAVQAGKVVELQTDAANSFAIPASITIPYDTTKGDVPGVYYYDEVNKAYEAVALTDIDKVKGLVTFNTAHFSKFVPMVSSNVSGTATTLPAVDTLFLPSVDGFYVPNNSNFNIPGGASPAMTASSIYYFNYLKAVDTVGLLNNTKGLFNKDRQGDPNLYQDDVNILTFIGALETAVSANWAINWKMPNYKLSDKNTGLSLIAAMQTTGKPQILNMKAVDGQGADLQQAQEVVVYKFVPDGGDPTQGTFFLYDPGFRGEDSVTIHWSMNDNSGNGSFTNYSKANAFSNPFNRFALDSPSTLASNSDFKMLFQALDDGFVGNKYAVITLTSPQLVNDAFTYTITDPNNISIPVSGSVSGAAYLLVFLNNDPTPIQTITLPQNGTFNFTVTGPLNSTNTLSFIATNSLCNMLKAPGYRLVTINAVGQSISFLNNGCFETGDTTGWTVETHTWNDPNTSFDFSGSPNPGDANFNPDYGVILSYTPNTVNPGKSAIVSVGLDPWVQSRVNGNTPSLALVQWGNYALRVNNEDNNYHISTASQTAVIPASVITNTFILKWAAVLEDPNHSPSQQPFVEVAVIDLDAVAPSNGVLYRKHFFSNDPRYTGGWIILGTSGWKMIDWQTANVDISKAKGHRVQVSITGADCAAGGHGGYALIDIEQCSAPAPSSRI